jgi:hypothetical protein
MRTFQVIFGCIMLSGLTGCSTAPKVDSTLVTASQLPSMQKYNDYVGKDYWIIGYLQLCERPASLQCHEFLQAKTHLKIDGLVTNHVEIKGQSSDNPYFHIVLDDGRPGFVDALVLTTATTPVDPAVAAAECKKRGEPKLGMHAPQVAATCWGRPSSVSTKIRKTGKYERYVYGNNKFVYLRNGVVISVSVNGRSSNADQFSR